MGSNQSQEITHIIHKTALKISKERGASRKKHLRISSPSCLSKISTQNTRRTPKTLKEIIETRLEKNTPSQKKIENPTALSRFDFNNNPTKVDIRFVIKSKRRVISNPVSSAGTPIFRDSSDFDSHRIFGGQSNAGTPIFRYSLNYDTKRKNANNFKQSKLLTEEHAPKKQNTLGLLTVLNSPKGTETSSLPFDLIKSNELTSKHRRVASNGLPVKLFDTRANSEKNLNIMVNDSLKTPNVLESLNLQKISMRRRRSFNIDMEHIDQDYY